MMDKTILNLLFNYKGSISYREFRTGSIILFMLTATVLSLAFFAAYSTLIIGRVGGEEQLASYAVYRQVIWPFIPALVPAQFIIAYSSFVLALRRMRFMKKFNELASAIINFLFFAASISSILAVIQLMGKGSSQTNIYQIISSPIFIGALAVFVVLGLANFVYLAMRHDFEPKHTPAIQEQKLDAITYTIKLGNIMAVMGILSILTGIGIFLSFFTIFDEEMLRAFAILFFVMPIGFYIKYTLYRMKDAKIPMIWLICIMGGYLAVAVGYLLSVAYLPGFFTIFTTVFEIATAIFVFGQYLLFLLPSQKATVSVAEQVLEKIRADFVAAK